MHHQLAGVPWISKRCLNGFWVLWSRLPARVPLLLFVERRSPPPEGELNVEIDKQCKNLGGDSISMGLCSSLIGLQVKFRELGESMSHAWSRLHWKSECSNKNFQVQHCHHSNPWAPSHHSFDLKTVQCIHLTWESHIPNSVGIVEWGPHCGCNQNRPLQFHNSLC